MCSEITSIRDEQDEHWPFRLKEEGRRRPEQDSESVESEQRRMSPTEFRGHGIRQLIEDLRAEFGEELCAQQEMFFKARADLEARQEEALANAWAVFQSSMTSMRSPANENTHISRV